jgi:hypothetical protein
MKSVPLDTSPDTQQVLLELLRNATAAQKLELTFGLTHALRELIIADVRRRFPDAPEDELRNRVIARLLPRDAVIQAYGFDPELAGYR